MSHERHDLAIRLVEERGRLGLSQAEMARLLGVSREGLRLNEMGQRGMAAEFLGDCVTLGVDVQYVITGIRSQNFEAALEKNTSGVKGQNIASSNVVNFAHAGSTITQINTARHTTKTIAKVEPGELHITDSQAATLKDLVDEVVRTELRLKEKPRTHQAIFSAMNSHCKVTSYRLIALADFEKARKFLQQSMGRLMSMKSAPSKTGDAWRKRHYAYIKINTKNEADDEACKVYLKKNFQATSITELSNDELEKVYRYVAGRRSKNK
jgi:transcriptional regulator with XRE-family HTH domain